MQRSQLNDLTGMRFGRWTVIRRCGSKTYGKLGASRSFPLWLCRCDCGAECLVLGNNLKSGRSKSCGCLREDLLERRHQARDRSGAFIPADRA